MKASSALLLAAFVTQTLAAQSTYPAPAPVLATPEPPGRVLLFTGPGFSGECYIVQAGESVINFDNIRRAKHGKWNDSISSIRIEGRVRVEAFADSRFRGARLEIDRDVRDLAHDHHGAPGDASWDDRISSLRVEAIAPPTQQPDFPPAPEFTSVREADHAIDRAYRDILGRRADREGRETYRRRLLRDAWTEARMRAQLKDSDEFRNRDPDTVVRAAYQEVLRRAPDDSGLNAYRERVRRDAWTQADVESDLRHSGEAADLQARTIISRVYREVLGRDPDPEGLAAYTRRLREDGWSEQRLRDALRNSDEYRNRPR